MLSLNRFRPWFYAAALYNAAWGLAVMAMPNLLFDLLNMPRPNYPELFQCIGMIVGVYAIGYWLVARDPARYGAFVYIGLLGKTLGPIGFLFGALQHRLPWQFGWINVFNDLIWLPAFAVFVIVFTKCEHAAKAERAV